MLHNFDTMVAQLNITVLNAIRVRLRYFVEFFADLVGRLHINLKWMGGGDSGRIIAFLFYLTFSTTFTALTLAIIWGLLIIF